MIIFSTWVSSAGLLFSPRFLASVSFLFLLFQWTRTDLVLLAWVGSTLALFHFGCLGTKLLRSALVDFVPTHLSLVLCCCFFGRILLGPFSVISVMCSLRFSPCHTCSTCSTSQHAVLVFTFSTLYSCGFSYRAIYWANRELTGSGCCMWLLASGQPWWVPVACRPP